MLINRLVATANLFDVKGRVEEASRVDRLIKVVAQELPADVRALSDKELVGWSRWLHNYAAETRNQIVGAKTPSDRTRLEVGLAEIGRTNKLLDDEIARRQIDPRELAKSLAPSKPSDQPTQADLEEIFGPDA